MYDVYLGGVGNSHWREVFKREIGKEVTVFDPSVEQYDNFNEAQRANQTAREFYYIDQSRVIVYYINNTWKGVMSLISLGDSVAHEKNVVVCVDGNPDVYEKVKLYCEYRGVIFVENMEDMITTVEEYLAQIEMCDAMGL